eukprot:5447764-Alexandrium_andersonii.AAC.1
MTEVAQQNYDSHACAQFRRFFARAPYGQGPCAPGRDAQGQRGQGGHEEHCYACAHPKKKRWFFASEVEGAFPDPELAQGHSVGPTRIRPASAAPWRRMRPPMLRRGEGV